MISNLRRHRATRATLSVLSILGMLLVNAGVAYAGFGITPPYVNNQRLTRGSVFEQRITLVRSDPIDDLTTTITMNAPGIENWISIDRGQQFIMPKGVTAVPIVITVHVPANAEYKEYKGAIRVRTASTNVPTGGGVSIALGAQIDVNLKVVDKIYDFNVRQIRVASMEEGRTKWGLYFPGKIRFFMTIENTGNTDFGPTKVHFDIYDSNQENLIESIDNINNIEKISPFAIKEVLAEIPTRLPAGSYIAKYTIYKNQEIAQQNTLNLNIASIGSVLGYEGYGFDGLSLSDKLKVIGAIGVPLFFLVLIMVLVISRRNKRKRKISHAPRSR